MTYTLTIEEPDGDGVIFVEGNKITSYPFTKDYSDGTDVTLEAQPYALWEFVQWTGDINSTESTTVVTMNADKTASATFNYATDIEFLPDANYRKRMLDNLPNFWRYNE